MDITNEESNSLHEKQKQVSSSKVKIGKPAAESTSSGLFRGAPTTQRTALLLWAGPAPFRAPWGSLNSSLKLHRKERVHSHSAPFHCKECLK